MEEQLYKVMAMLMLIHNENMSILQCLIRRDKAKEITDSYKEQMESILKGNMEEDK